MDKTALVGPDIDQGRRFLELLAEATVPVKAALWQASELSEGWNLTIVTPLVMERGLKEAYRRFVEILAGAPDDSRIDLDHVSLLAPDSRLYRSLRREMRDVRSLPISKQRIGGQFVDQAYIYFVK